MTILTDEEIDEGFIEVQWYWLAIILVGVLLLPVLW